MSVWDEVVGQEPTVDALRGLYRHSSVGNAGNRG